MSLCTHSFRLVPTGNRSTHICNKEVLSHGPCPMARGPWPCPWLFAEIPGRLEDPKDRGTLGKNFRTNNLALLSACAR